MDDDTRNRAELNDNDAFEDLPPTIQRRPRKPRRANYTPKHPAAYPSTSDDEAGETFSFQPPDLNEASEDIDPTTDFSAPRTPTHETAILHDDPHAYWRRDPYAPRGTATLSPKQEIILVIRGTVERVFLAENQSVILGRAEPGSRPRRRLIDLMPYGALERGVSRRHARLYLKDNNLFLTDLNSTNGTYLAGERLNPNEPTLLRKGDEILLGRLAVEILFH